MLFIFILKLIMTGMRTKCSVTNCLVTIDDGIPLHRFPNAELNPELYDTWVSIVGNNIHKFNKKYVYNNYRVCRKHFKDVYLYPSNRLCKLAIPELLLPGISSKETKSISDTNLPASDTSLPLPDTSLPTSKTSLPPLDTQLAPSNTQLTPSETQLTPLNTTLTPSDSHITPSDTTLTPSETRVAPDTRITPLVTRVTSSGTRIRPPVIRITPLVTHITPDSRATPSTTEDDIDNDDSQDLDSAKDNNIEKPAPQKTKTCITNFTVWSGKPPKAKPYELNQPIKKPVLVMPRANSKTFISGRNTSEIAVKSAAPLSVSTASSPELPEEMADKKLDGFKLGVSEKVLQFRLVNDGDCDEPIYKVLTEEEPAKKEIITICSTGTEHNTVMQKETSITEENDVESESEYKENVTKYEKLKENVTEYEKLKENVTKYEKPKDMEYWKLRLTHILHETKFCGICLNAEHGMNAITDELEIVNCEVTYRNTVRQIVDRVFKETDYPLANSQVCKSCTKKLIQSYIFIRNAEETAKVLNRHLDELYYKTCYIRNNELKNKQAGSEIYNVVIALDNEISKSFDLDLNPEEAETAKSDLNRPRAKRKLQCLSCNVILPTYRVWRVHETKYHKTNHRCRICLQNFKTRQDFTAHYRMHLNSRCSICHRKVQGRRLVQHLKRCHADSIHLCSTCDVAFYSATALDRHNRESHYSADSKCVTCLRSFSRDELEVHRCRFACPECDETPCVHHEYLMSYRKQAQNLVDRAGCKHCSYVYTSKEALVAHANARHLDIKPHRCGRCAQTFHCRSDLKNHGCTPRGTSKYVHVCQYCEKQFSKEVMCQQHSRICERVQRRYQCDYCTANFDSSKNLMEHRKRKHGKDMFSCNFCDKVFLNNMKKDKHLQQVHGRHRGTASGFDCVLCRKKFPTKAALLLHLRYHEPGTKLPCGVCRAQFDTVAQFSAHSCKSTRLLSMCETCGQVVKQVLLRKHMRAHSGAAVACDTCGRCFQNVAALQCHHKLHQRNVSCRICKKLINSAKLWRHFRNHLIRDCCQEKLMKNLI